MAAAKIVQDALEAFWQLPKSSKTLLDGSWTRNKPSRTLSDGSWTRHQMIFAKSPTISPSGKKPPLGRTGRTRRPQPEDSALRARQTEDLSVLQSLQAFLAQVPGVEALRPQPIDHGHRHVHIGEEPHALLGRMDFFPSQPGGVLQAFPKILFLEVRVVAEDSLGGNAAQRLRDDTLRAILNLTEDWQERAKVYQEIPELLDDPERALALVDQLRQLTSDGNDLFFLDQTVGAAVSAEPDDDIAF